MAKLTIDQAKDLVDAGMLTADDVKKLAASGDLSVFKYSLRNADEKPTIVHDTMAALIAVIEPVAIDLYMAGYRPAIMWKRIGDKDEEEIEAAE